MENLIVKATKRQRFDFDLFFSYLLQYKVKFGNCLVPQKYEIDGYKLGKKIMSIRTGNITLNEDQKAKLNEVGFVWNATFYFDFDKFYKYLFEYKAEFGNCLVPLKYEIDGYKLGQKIASIRTGHITLNEDQKAKLNEVGFVWDVRVKNKNIKFDFNKFYRRLVKYKDEFSNVCIPYDYVIENYELGYYIRQIRTKRIKLNEEQIEKLKELGFVFDTHNQLYPNIEYSTNDNSNYLANNMLNGDMLAREILYKKFIPAIYFYANRIKNQTIRDDVISYLSEQLLLIIDNIQRSSTVVTYILKSMKGYYLSFVKKYYQNAEISIYTAKQETSNLTLETHLKSKEDENPDVIANSNVFNEQLIARLKQHLTKNEFRLIAYYFGINCKRKTVEELAEKYNVSEVKVKKAIIRVIKYLKTKLNESEWNYNF